MPNIESVINAFKEISNRVGENAIGWRYDPIFYSDKINKKTHIENFTKIAKALKGYTKMCVISVLDMYEKVKKLKIAEAIVNTISGAIGAYMQAVSAYPPPYGEILGGISTAAVTAAGMAQVANIRQQTIGGGSSSVKAMATPQTQVYQPEYTENPTGDNEINNLRNTLYSRPIRAFVVESDITESQKRANIRNEESTF